MGRAERRLRELCAYFANSEVKKQKINHRVREECAECAEKKLGRGAGGSANSAPTPRTLRLEKMVAMKKNTKKIIILGLDGGTWQVFDRLFAKGKMKNLQRIISSGVRGDLKSTVPPVTGPAWVSFATGKNPGKHGCFDFTFPDGSLSRLRTISTERINGKTFYEYLVDAGKKIILINMPVSYPPRTEEVTITSLLTKGEQCVFPENLIDEIPLLKNYHITADMNLLAQEKYDEYFENIRAVEKIRFQSARQLFQREWDFFFLLFSGVDWIQHVKLDALLSEKFDEKSPLLKYFDDVDEYLAWFFEKLDDNTNLIIISDHGFQVFQGTFYVNEWLHQQGYLKLKNQSAPENDAHQVAADLEGAYKKKWKRLQLPFWVRKIILSNRWLNKVGVKIYQTLRDKFSLQMRVEVSPNLAESQAYCTTSELGGIYLNRKDRFRDGTVEEHEYFDLRNKIIAELRDLKDDQGKRIFDEVLEKEAVYRGEKLNEAPDILIKSGRYAIGSSFSAQILDHKKNFNHHQIGIFIATGKDLKKGVEIGTAELIDIAPTVLHLLDLPIPDDMDGQVIVSAIRSEQMAKKSIRYIKAENFIPKKSKLTEQSDELVAQRLRGLGYME